MTTAAPSPPIYKVGIVLVRDGAGGGASLSDGQGAPEILIIRPQPKNAGEIPKFVLPRGSRQYRDAAGDWHDARDAATALEHAATLEPLTRTLAREAEEEAGLSPDHLNALQACGVVNELGARRFASSSKAPYSVHWFVAKLTGEDAAKLTAPEDASEVRWASLGDIKLLEAGKQFSSGYLPVIEEALQTLGMLVSRGGGLTR